MSIWDWLQLLWDFIIFFRNFFGFIHYILTIYIFLNKQYYSILYDNKFNSILSEIAPNLIIFKHGNQYKFVDNTGKFHELNKELTIKL